MLRGYGYRIGYACAVACGSEVHNSDVTFLRQIGSYPIVVAIPERVPLNERFDVRVTGYMRRSLTAERIH